jgi:V-type H+-transporting ATPase subunit H
MESSDEFVKLSAMQTTCLLLSHAPGTPSFTGAVLDEVARSLELPNSNRREIAVQALGVLLTKPSMRSAVWSKPNLTARCDLVPDLRFKADFYQLG